MLTPQEQLSRAIKAARAQRGWTQKDLAKALGVSRSTVATYETGTNWPQAVQAHQLAEVLGITVPDQPHDGPVKAPPRLDAMQARGVRYAALRMSETLTALLREAAEAEDAAEETALRSTIVTTTRAAAKAPAGRASSAPPARRQRRG